MSTINKQKFNQACNFCLLPWIYKDGNDRVFDMFLFFFIIITVMKEMKKTAS